MKKLILSFSLAAVVFSASDAQQLKLPAPSPTTTIKQDFALSSVELNYSRPVVKGRKIFGDLVPYGKVWRTGANSATTISFGEDVTVGDKAVPAGKYGLLTIPGEKEWTVIITKQLDVTSPSAYKQDQDVARVQVKSAAFSYPVESLTILFSDVKQSTMDLELFWDKTMISIPIKADIDSKVMAQIDNLMNKDNRPYFQAGMYYMETGRDINKSIEWFDKAIAQNPKAFWVYHQKANALAKLGKKSDATAAANKSIELAKEAQNDDYVALNQKLLATLK